MTATRTRISELIGIKSDDLLDKIEYKVIESTKESGYTRNRIEFDSLGDKVIAYLLIPDTVNNSPAILINHQHNSERHLGKSEVCGISGNPLQAFGSTLAQKGFVVLSPDSICFEDRRVNGEGITPMAGEGDFLQHYNEMCYRLINGETLMKKVLTDAMNCITLLSSLEYVNSKNVGTLGHSYGGNTVLFLSAIDQRIAFSCASGSGVTYKNRIQNNVGIEMSSVIPGFHSEYDIDDVVCCIAPRPLLIVSADDDKYSKDADFVVGQAKHSYAKYQSEDKLQHMRYTGGHALTKERADFIVDWVSSFRTV